jgi:hypothetical protein
LVDWLQTTGLIDMAENKEKVLQSAKECCRNATYLIPNLDPNDEKMKAFMLYMIFIGMAADMSDLQSMDTSGRHNAKMGQLLSKVVGDIISFKYKSLDDLPDVPDKVLPFFKALFAASEKARSAIPGFETDSSFFVTGMNRTMIGNMTMLMMEEPDIALVNYFGRFECGGEALIELAALASALVIGDAVRQNIFFSRIMELASSIIFHLFDVFNLGTGLRKNNSVEMKAEVEEIPLEVALTQTLELVGREVQELKLFCDTTVELNPRNIRFAKFIKVVQRLIDGHTYSLEHKLRNP